MSAMTKVTMPAGSPRGERGSRPAHGDVAAPSAAGSAGAMRGTVRPEGRAREAFGHAAETRDE